MQYVQDNSTDGILNTANSTDIIDDEELDHHECEDDSDNESMVDLDGNDIIREPRVPIPQLYDDDAKILPYLRQAYSKSPLLSCDIEGIIVHASLAHFRVYPVTRNHSPGIRRQRQSVQKPLSTHTLGCIL